MGDIGAGAVSGAFFAGWGVEGEEGRLEVAALPPCVEAAAPLVVAAGVFPFALREVEIFPVASGLVGFDAGAADAAGEETGDGEGVVADEFSVETPAAGASEVAVGGVAGEVIGGSGG